MLQVLSSRNIARKSLTIRYFFQVSSNPYRASPLLRGSLHSSVLDPITAQLQSPKQLGSPQLTSPLGLGNTGEVQRLSEELMAARSKLASWEESWTQAKQACDAWKKEAEASAEKAKRAGQEKEDALIKKDEVPLFLSYPFDVFLTPTAKSFKPCFAAFA